MGKCINHPDRETSYLCQKHNIYMCEECIKCRDPEIYCKFRSSCPIWFMNKGKAGWEEKEKNEAQIPRHQVTFQPDNIQVTVPHGATLLDAAREADIHINASCNGKGSCGKCKLIHETGSITSQSTTLLSANEKARNYILACQSSVQGDVVVSIPKETIERKLKAAGMGHEASERLQNLVTDIQPMIVEVPLELDPPTLDDSVSDLDRLMRGLKKTGCDTSRLNISLKVMRDLADIMRRDHWKVTATIIRNKFANEILAVASGNGKAQSLGLAIDVGTTSVVVYLVDMADGAILGATSAHNKQASCGDDVINRIVCAEKSGVGKLSRMALATINNLISEVLDSVGANFKQIKNIVFSGNTTMLHLLLKIEPRYIRREPYIPTVSEFPIMKAREIGVKANPIAAVFVMPGPASYVGGDITSGLLYTGLHREEALSLFIDIGTNGEIVLGNNEWMMCAACSAGPAFEGGGIRWGMRAEEGAIEKIQIDPQTREPKYETVGNVSPRGVCGSGMIDLMSEMLITGIIDPNGKFKLDENHPRLRVDEQDKAYIIALADETDMEEDIVFTETDIHSLILSKGAVYAGFTVLLNQAGIDFDMVERIIITGGFGQYLNIDKAVTIGLLPDIDRGKFSYKGNSSIAGAYMALLSDELRKEARDISNRMTYIDFSSSGGYMDEFTSALFLPHTNTKAFPSVERQMQKALK